MIPWLFTTGWGLLYLAVLVLLMGPALLRAERRWLAAAMFLLFVLDRLAVNALPQELALFFLAFAYTLVAFAVTITHLAAPPSWLAPPCSPHRLPSLRAASRLSIGILPEQSRSYAASSRWSP